ncbi:MAG: hypothetical protein M0R77_10380 [Gammaproteobacteria bacterium]|nr:hypothetical protein [Gammaproteobacteria bacterium]
MDPTTVIAIAVVIIAVYITWPLWVILLGMLALIAAAVGGFCLILLAYVYEKLTRPFRRRRNLRQLDVRLKKRN